MCSDLILEHRYLYYDQGGNDRSAVDLLQANQDENVCTFSLSCPEQQTQQKSHI